MTAPLLELAARRASAADAVLKTDETLTLTLPDRGEGQVSREPSSWCQLRVHHEGRVGYAGSTSPGEWPALVDEAVTSAGGSAPAELFLPAPAPGPTVVTAHPAAAVAGPAEVAELASLLATRLAARQQGRSVWVERSAGAVEVANSRGVVVRYDATLVGFGVQVSPRAGVHPACAIHHVAATWPGSAEVEAIAAEVDRRLDPRVLAEPPPDRARICLAPRAVMGLLRPVVRGLTIGALRSLGTQLQDGGAQGPFGTGLTLRDDPLESCRPGSRPADDEGVVSRPLTLIDSGRLKQGIADLTSGARFAVPSTGHGRRSPHAPPRPAFSNLVVSAGPVSEHELLAGSAETILLLDAPDLGVGPMAATSPQLAWAYRVSGGEIVGRYPGIRLLATPLQMLERLLAVGKEALWNGSWCCPSLLLDEIEIVPA